MYPFPRFLRNIFHVVQRKFTQNRVDVLHIRHSQPRCFVLYLLWTSIIQAPGAMAVGRWLLFARLRLRAKNMKGTLRAEKSVTCLPPPSSSRRARTCLRMVLKIPRKFYPAIHHHISSLHSALTDGIARRHWAGTGTKARDFEALVFPEAGPTFAGFEVGKNGFEHFALHDLNLRISRISTTRSEREWCACCT